MKAVAYARYSSTQQRSESTNALLHAIRAYAAKNKIDIIKVSWIKQKRPPTIIVGISKQMLLNRHEAIEQPCLTSLCTYCVDKVVSPFGTNKPMMSGFSVLSKTTLKPFFSFNRVAARHSPYPGIAGYNDHVMLEKEKRPA